MAITYLVPALLVAVVCMGASVDGELVCTGSDSSLARESCVATRALSDEMVNEHSKELIRI